jgi:hypothetical protein
MSKTVDEGTFYSLEWWDALTGTWARAGEFDSRDEATAERDRLDRNAKHEAWGEPATWQLVTTTIEAFSAGACLPSPTMLDQAERS